MKVVYLTVPGAATDAANTLIIQVDELYTITVRNYGTCEYAWKIQGPDDDAQLYQLTHEEFLSEATPDAGGFYPGSLLGKVLIWAEPITFAHTVMDLINNQ